MPALADGADDGHAAIASPSCYVRKKRVKALRHYFQAAHFVSDFLVYAWSPGMVATTL